jgi:uncharacterized protein YndB with AHSA1/START domain
VVALPGCSAARALSAFTDPDLLARWWGGGRLSTTLTVGGPYMVAFPALGRTMTGQVTGYQPGRSLEFSWGWDGVDGPGGTVRVQAGDGEPVTLTIEHGDYDDSEAGQEVRAEHRAGWEHFLPKLAATLSAEDD